MSCVLLSQILGSRQITYQLSYHLPTKAQLITDIYATGGGISQTIEESRRSVRQAIQEV